MANIGSFNPQQFEPLGEFTSVPKGEWNVIIADSEVDQSNPNDPKLVLHLEFVGGEADGNKAKGGKADIHLWLWAPSENGKSKGDISRRKLRSITDALGFFQQFEDTAVLHNKPFTVKTDIRWVEKRDGSGYTGFPDVKSFGQYKGQQAAGADPVQPQAPAATAQTAPTLPSAPAFGAPAFGAAPTMPTTPAAPAPGQFAPPAMPAYAAPPVATQQAPAQGFAPPMGNFAPPAAPAAPAFQPPVPGAPGPWGPR